MSDLSDIIRHQIKADGPMAVSKYMALALGHPQFGYYMRSDPFGTDGDFITAPEISQMFGEMIGVWVAVVWQALGQPNPFNLIELGPGRGTLMADAVRAAEKMPGFDDAARITFVEISPVLKEKQKKTMAGMFSMPAWRDNFSDAAADFADGPSIIIANEFFDALAIDQYEKFEDGWYVRTVDWAEGENGEAGAFVFAQGRRLDDESVIAASLRTASPGALFEHCESGAQIMSDIAAHIQAQGGAALVFDYGHVEPGIGETLQALKAHEFFNPLETPGEADLTAHVDFSMLADTAMAAGVQVFGPVPQGAFLSRLGLRQRADRLILNATPEQTQEIESAHSRLVEADQMGAMFKTLAIASPGLGLPPWSG